MTPRQRHQRRATLYLMVLGSALIVTLIGVSALIAVRIRQESSEDGYDFIVARTNAQSAVDWGQFRLSIDPNWRTTYSSGTVVATRNFGTGTITARIIDPVDGNLTNSASDPVLMIGTGTCGPAVYHLQVLLQSPVEPLAALNTCLHAGGNITIDWGETVTVTGAPLSTNSDYASGGYLNGNLETQGYWSYYSVNGTVTRPGPIKELPASDVYDRYKALATTISYPGDVSAKLISPTTNPWGAANADGVYFIDTGGASPWIRGTRLYGTLIVRTRGGTLNVAHDVLFSPAREDYPVLIVNGNLALHMDCPEPLRENDWGTNFNPTGAPYEGATDTDKSDTYPCDLRGLVHVTGNLHIETPSHITGVVICEGTVECADRLEIQHDDGLYLLPPQYYSKYGAPTPTPDSWCRRLTVP